MDEDAAHPDAAQQQHVLRQRPVELGVGDGAAQTIGIDLGPGYIRENVKTS